MTSKPTLQNLQRHHLLLRSSLRWGLRALRVRPVFKGLRVIQEFKGFQGLKAQPGPLVHPGQLDPLELLDLRAIQAQPGHKVLQDLQALRAFRELPVRREIPGLLDRLGPLILTPSAALRLHRLHSTDVPVEPQPQLQLLDPHHHQHKEE
jgi:hypothetical protein